MAAADSRLQQRFEHNVDRGTVERIVSELVEQLAAEAKFGAWIPILAERAAADHLENLPQAGMPSEDG